MSNYRVKGRLHAKRFTTKPGNCRVCDGALPTPRPNSKRICDRCESDPAYLKSKREKENERERMRDRAKRASQQKPTSVVRICKHRDQKAGEICGIEFEARPRIGKNGHNRGVSPLQKYCPKHRTPKAIARRRWLNRDPKKYKVYARNYRHRNLKAVRARQRAAAKEKRARVAAILAGNIRINPQPTGRPAHRPIEQTTEERIRLAARLEIDGLRPYAMTDRLYPPSADVPAEKRAFDRRRRFDATNQFLRRHRKRIDAEKQVAVLPENSATSLRPARAE
jgi:hypothetical protein